MIVYVCCIKCDFCEAEIGRECGEPITDLVGFVVNSMEIYGIVNVLLSCFSNQLMKTN